MANRDKQRVGIESKTRADGTEVFRGYVRVPGRRSPLKGPWRESLAEARAWRFKTLARREDGALTPEGPTVGAAFASWLAEARAGNAWSRSGRPYAPRTLDGYEQGFRDHLAPAVEHAPVGKLRRSTVQRLVDELAAEYTGQTARNAVNALRALYRYLLGRHDGLVDPTDGLHLPAGSKPRERFASPAEVVALLDALDADDTVVLALAAYAGLRRGELRRLQLGDVDLRAGRILVRDAKTDAGTGRTVPILARLRPYVEWRAATLDGRPDTPFLPGREGRPKFSDAAFRERAYAAWDAKELEHLGLHEARHTFASLVLAAAGANGMDRYAIAKRLSEWMGHTSVAFTLDQYAKLFRRYEDTVVSSIDAWLADA